MGIITRSEPGGTAGRSTTSTTAYPSSPARGRSSSDRQQQRQPYFPPGSTVAGSGSASSAPLVGNGTSNNSSGGGMMRQHRSRTETGSRSNSPRRSLADVVLEAGAAPRPTPRRVSSVSLSLRGEEHLSSRYDEYRLAQSLLRHQETRNTSLKDEGRRQVFYPKSNAGWIATLCMTEGRALDWMGLPFLITVIHGTVYTIIQETLLKSSTAPNTEVREIFFALVLNTTLSALLVFRLNSAQDRFWEARSYWGDIVEKGRSFVGGVIAHSGDGHEQQQQTIERDHCIRWVAAFALSIMELVRGTGELPVDHFAGILDLSEIHELADNAHPPVYAANKVRYHLRRTFAIDTNTPMPFVVTRTRNLDNLELQLNVMLDGCGGLQRIRSTPLPMVCVSHLRTLLMLSMIALPYIWGPSWGIRTIPIVVIAAFAWFGIEASSAEVESPFREDRVNALNMDGFCIGLLQTIQQQVVTHADEDIKRKEMIKLDKEMNKKQKKNIDKDNKDMDNDNIIDDITDTTKKKKTTTQMIDPNDPGPQLL